MLGTVAIQIVVPTKGLITNVPNYQNPPDSLVDGSNVYVDEDGLLKARQGYSLVGTTLPTERITGIVNYRDQSGSFQVVLGTDTQWWKYDDNGMFTSIGGPTGDADDPAHFTPFQQNGATWVYGVNNQDGLWRWNSSLSMAQQVIGGGSFPITNIVGNADGTATVTLPNNPLGIKPGDSVTIAGNTEAPFNGTWVVTSVGFNTFTFASADTNTGTGGTAVDADGGVPFATARDIEVIANRLVVVNTSEGGTQYPFRVRWSSVNDGTTWPVLGFLDMQDSFGDAIVGLLHTSENTAIIYRDLSAWLLYAYPGGDANAFATERINTTDNMTGPCGPSAMVMAEGYHFYLGQDGRVYQFDGNTIHPISDPIDPVVRPLLNAETSDRVSATYLPNKRSVLFFFPPLGEEDPTMAVMYSIRRQAFEPLITLAGPMTAAAVVNNAMGVTWNVAPNYWQTASATWASMDPTYTSWTSIPATNTLSCWTGDTQGNVYSFFTATTDNGTVIPYYAVYPPVRQDPRKTQKISTIELYLQQAASPETLSFIVWGLLQPYTTPGTSIMAMAIQQADQTTFEVPAQPGPLNPQNIAANFLQFELSSAGALAQLVFAGGTLFCDLDDRGSGYGVQ